MTRKVSELLSGRGNVARNCGAASRHPFHLKVLLAYGHTTHGDATHLPRLAAAPARHQQRLVGLVAKDAHRHPMRHPLRAGGQVQAMGEAEELLRAHDQAELSLDRLREACHRLEDHRRRATRVDIVGVAAGAAADCRQLPVERRQLGGDAHGWVCWISARPRSYARRAAWRVGWPRRRAQARRAHVEKRASLKVPETKSYWISAGFPRELRVQFRGRRSPIRNEFGNS